MNKSNFPLRLNVGYMYQKPIGTSRQIPVEIENVAIDDLFINSLRSVVQLSRTREGMLLQVQADADVISECVRCLVEFSLAVKVEFDELYQFPTRHCEETDLVLPDDGFIDLGPLYREYLILAMPIKQICRPGCKGLCVVCGKNLNLADCEHEQEKELTKTIKAEKED